MILALFPLTPPPIRPLEGGTTDDPIVVAIALTLFVVWVIVALAIGIRMAKKHK
jgi:hypothetical protein